MASSTDSILNSKIRTLKKELKAIKRLNGYDQELLQLKENDLRDLLLKYRDLTRREFSYTEQELAEEFCADYFAEIDADERKIGSISGYYEKHSSLITVGHSVVKGREHIAGLIMNKFKGIRTHHEIVKAVLDKEPPSKCAMVINCTCRLKLDNDQPRKILQIFEVIRVAEKDKTNSSSLLITKELFIVQDARPLYHNAEATIPVTAHDNWEPQFKPAVVEVTAEEQQVDASPTAGQTVAAGVEVSQTEGSGTSVDGDSGDDEDDDDEAEEEEEDAVPAVETGDHNYEQQQQQPSSEEQFHQQEQEEGLVGGGGVDEASPVYEEVVAAVDEGGGGGEEVWPGEGVEADEQQQ